MKFIAKEHKNLHYPALEMTLINQSPAHRFLEQEAAKSKARNDHAYEEERKQLAEKLRKYETLDQPSG